MVSLASLAGERIFFDGDNQSGVAGDLESATTIAALMEGFWGMGSTVSSHAASMRLRLGGPNTPRPDDKDDVDPMSGPLGVRVEENLQRLLVQVSELLQANYHSVLAVAHLLETNKTVSGEDVEAVIDGVQGPIHDGRPYFTEQGKAELDRYHAIAVAAKGTHGEITEPLPNMSSISLGPIALAGSVASTIENED